MRLMFKINREDVNILVQNVVVSIEILVLFFIAYLNL